jgi:hypothetical protein
VLSVEPVLTAPGSEGRHDPALARLSCSTDNSDISTFEVLVPDRGAGARRGSSDHAASLRSRGAAVSAEISRKERIGGSEGDGHERRSLGTRIFSFELIGRLLVCNSV